MSPAGEGGRERCRRVVLFCDTSGFMRLSVSPGSGMPGFVQERYEAAGEAVARAAVLDHAPGIVVTSEVRRALGAEFRTEKLPAIPLKWKAEALEAWRVMQEQGTAGAAAGRLTG